MSFVTDTDSKKIVIDSGSYRIIVIDTSLLNNSHVTADKIKGIGGSLVHVTGGGKINLNSLSDGSQVLRMPNLDAVFVPSSPYNLIFP